MNKYLTATESWRSLYRQPHSIAILRDVARKSANKRVEARKTDALKEIRGNEELIRNRINCYENLFKTLDYQSPLLHQLERTLENGFSTVNRFVDTLLICEMTKGVLMGAQDYGQVNGELVFDLATAGEQYDGMRDTVICKEGETVVRDDSAIVVSLFQGSDKRTAITRQTSDVLFFAFSVEGVSDQDVMAALNQAVEILEPAAREVHIETL